MARAKTNVERRANGFNKVFDMMRFSMVLQSNQRIAASEIGACRGCTSPAATVKSEGEELDQKDSGAE